MSAYPKRQASPDPRNTFEVTVPPLFGQDQSFSFTFRPACPGPVTVKISVDPRPTTLVNPPAQAISVCTPIPLAPIQKPSTPTRASVGVSAVPNTPPRTFISRAVSPPPLELLLPPDLAEWLAETQFTQPTHICSRSPVHVAQVRSPVRAQVRSPIRAQVRSPIHVAQVRSPVRAQVRSPVRAQVRSPLRVAHSHYPVPVAQGRTTSKSKGGKGLRTRGQSPEVVPETQEEHALDFLTSTTLQKPRETQEERALDFLTSTTLQKPSGSKRRKV